MNTTSEVRGQARDDTVEDASEPRNSGSRRSLLSGAAGGLVLATSGLFLPDWLLDEAEADNAPVRRVQQRKAQRRKRRRNQSDSGRKRRQHGHDKGRGGVGFRGLQISFSNTNFSSSDIQFWVHEPFIWRKKEDRTYPRGDFSFTTDNLEALLLINGKFCLEFHNYPVGTPDIFLGVDGSVRERGGWHPGLTVLPPTAVSEREYLPSTTVQGVRFELARNPDTPAYINFQVAMWPVSA